MSVQLDENNYLVEPFPDDLSASEREQINAVARTPDTTGESRLKAAAAIGGAFIVYQGYLKARLKRKLKGKDNLPVGEYAHEVAQAYQDFAPAWTYMVAPAVFSSYMSGVLESGQTVATQSLMELAQRYSWNLGQYLNKKTVDSAVRGYAAQLNRNLDARIALGNVIDAVGVTVPGMRSLVTIWTGKEEERPSEALMPSVKKARAKRVATADINAHAKLLGEQEVYSNSQTGKQLAWTAAQQLGLIPENATRQWVTAKDERVCPQCGPLHGMEVPINEPFMVGKQKVWTPSLHVNCRCGVKLKAHLFREVAGRGVSQAQRARRDWFGNEENDGVSKAAGLGVAKADDWDAREHPRDMRSGRFALRPTTAPVRYKEPEEDIQAQVREAQDREIADAAFQAFLNENLKPTTPERSMNAARNQGTGGGLDASSRRSMDASRPGMKAEPAPSLNAGRSLNASRSLDATRNLSAERSLDASRGPIQPISAKPAPPPRPKSAPKKRYVSLPENAPMWSVLQDHDFEVYYVNVGGKPIQSVTVNNAYFTTDQNKLELLKDHYRSERVREAKDEWHRRSSKISGQITMPAPDVGPDANFLIDDSVLSDALRWRQQANIDLAVGRRPQEEIVELHAYDPDAPGGRSMSRWGLPVQDPGHAAKMGVTLSEIADYFNMDQLIDNMEPQVVEIRRFPAETNFDIDSETGSDEAMVEDEYLVEYIPKTPMVGYKPQIRMVLKPRDDED